MSKHTPGPWTADVQYIVRDSSGDEVATCAIAAQLLTAKDNAALIAAAPDLLAALKEYVRDFGDNEDSDSQLMAEKARAAIAKAEGGS